MVELSSRCAAPHHPLMPRHRPRWGCARRHAVGSPPPSTRRQRRGSMSEFCERFFGLPYRSLLCACLLTHKVGKHRVVAVHYNYNKLLSQVKRIGSRRATSHCAARKSYGAVAAELSRWYPETSDDTAKPTRWHPNINTRLQRSILEIPNFWIDWIGMENGDWWRYCYILKKESNKGWYKT